jgi:hypothetical protein
MPDRAQAITFPTLARRPRHRSGAHPGNAHPGTAARATITALAGRESALSPVGEAVTNSMVETAEAVTARKNTRHVSLSH